MPPKRKEEKKLESNKEIDSLPACNSWIVHLSTHPFLAPLSKLFKAEGMSVISNEDLENQVRDFSMEVSASSKAQVLKQQLTDLELPFRQGKSEAVTEETIELTVVLKDYPSTLEEIEAIYAQDIQISHCILLKPSARVFAKKSEEAEEPLLTESFCVFQDISKGQHAISTKTEIIWNTITVDLLEELEPKEEVKEEVKEDPKKKDPKAKKVEEPKEEVIEEQDPRMLVVQETCQNIQQVSESYTQYLNWKKKVTYRPLFPSKNMETDELASPASPGMDEVFSLDDSEREWDFRQFFKLTQQVPVSAATPQFLMACISLFLKSKAAVSEDESAKGPSYLARKRHELRNQVDSQDIRGSGNTYEEIPGSDKLYERPIEDIFVLLNETDAIQMASGRLCFSSTKEPIAAEEETCNRTFIFDGIDRFNMPVVDAEAKAQANAELTELLSFATLPRAEFDRALILQDFQAMLKRQQPERKWDLSDRVFEESLTAGQFLDIVQTLLTYEPDIATNYQSMRDCMYVAIAHKTPPGRILRKKWSWPWVVCPTFMWAYLDSQYTAMQDFLHIQPEKVGKLMARTKAMYPSDNSVIKMTRYLSGRPQPGNREHYFDFHASGVAFKDGVYFGMRESKEFWSYHGSEKFMVEMSAEGAVVHITTPELHVKIFPSGNILQHKHGNEETRVLCLRGYVLTFGKDATTVFTPSGEVATRSKERVWTVVNNKGRCLVRREVDSVLFNKEPIQVSTTTDPESLAVVTTREDLVMNVTYTDGSRTFYFPDSTKLHASADRNTVHVAADGYAACKYYFDPIKARQHTVIGIGSADSGLGAEDIMLRSHDGLLTELLLPTGTRVKLFRQRQEAEGGDVENMISLVYRADGNVYKIQQDGEIVFVSAETRAKLAEHHGQAAYFYELFSVSEDRSSGVYSANCATGQMWTHDSEGNHFTIYADGRAIEKLAVSLTVDEDIQSPEISDGEFIDDECRFLPPPGTVLSPRLFCVKDNQITEFMNQEQLSMHFRTHPGKCYTQQSEDRTYYTWVREVKEKEADFEDSPFKKYEIPNSFLPVMQSEVTPETPEGTVHSYRKIVEWPEFTQEKKEAFQEGLKLYEDTKKSREEERKRLEFKDQRSEEYRERQLEFLKSYLQEQGDSELLNKLFPTQESEEKVTESSSEEFVVDLSDDAMVEVSVNVL